MADNPFAITPVNPLQALMGFQQSYEGARKRTEEQAQQDALRAAAPDLAAGNYAAALGKVGQGGNASVLFQLAGLAQQEAQRKQTLAHQQVLEGFKGREVSLAEAADRRAAEEPKAVAPGTELVIPRGPKAGTKIYGSSEELTFDQPTLEAIAKQYRAGDTSVLTNVGRGAQGPQNIIKVRKEIARQNAVEGRTPEEQAMINAEYFGTKAGQRTVGTRGANIELAATEFKQVLPIVQAASKAVSRTNYPDLNKVIQAYNEKTGDPNIVRFGGGINTLINLYARAISPTGTPTVSDKDHAREILQKAWSQGQFDAAVGMMEQEVDAALASPEKVREDMRNRFLRGQGVGPKGDRQPPPATTTFPAAPPPPPGFTLVKP